MPFMTNWVHKPYIVKSVFTGIVSIIEVDAVMRDYLSKLNADHMLYFMIDFERAASIPTTLLQIDSIIEVINHVNTQWFVIVNPVGFDSNTTHLLMQDKVKIVNTKAKALGFLRAMVRLDTGLTFESD
jgi:hypothetical protein